MNKMSFADIRDEKILESSQLQNPFPILFELENFTKDCFELFRFHNEIIDVAIKLKHELEIN